MLKGTLVAIALIALGGTSTYTVLTVNNLKQDLEAQTAQNRDLADTIDDLRSQLARAEGSSSTIRLAVDENESKSTVAALSSASPRTRTCAPTWTASTSSS